MIQFLQRTGSTYAGTNDVVCPVAAMGAGLWGDVGSRAKREVPERPINGASTAIVS